MLTGSTSLVTDLAGTVIAETRYTPYGETRIAAGTSPTDYLYTSQRQETGLGLYFYNARWYDPYLNQFSQPDTIVPNPSNPQSYNRYSYVLNNPIRYNDPSGHVCSDPDDPTPTCDGGGGYPPNQTPLPEAPVQIEDTDVPNASYGPVVGNNSYFPTTVPATYSYPQYVAPLPMTQRSSQNTSPLDDIAFFIDKGAKPILEVIKNYEAAYNIGKPIGKQISYATSLGIFEYIGYGLVQYIDDSSKNLSPAQRLSRVGIVVAEAWIVDTIASAVGVKVGASVQLAFPETPGFSAVVGVVAGSWATSAVAYEGIERWGNPFLFSLLRLSEYP